MRLADDLGQARADLARVYDAVWPERVGHFARTAAWWDVALHDPEHERQGLTTLSCLLHFGAYGARTDTRCIPPPTDGKASGAASGVVRVRELMAGDPDVTAALWGFVLDMDLMARTEIGSVAVDDPLLHLLGDVRQAQPRVKDSLWVRLVDVGRALAGRRYAAPVDVVLDVTDELCAWNTGRWRLRADDVGATCERSSPTPTCPSTSRTWPVPTWVECRWPALPPPGGSSSTGPGRCGQRRRPSGGTGRRIARSCSDWC